MKLPAAYLNQEIRHLEVGESAWTVPWAMSVDPSRHCWLDTAFAAHNAPGGTVQLLVTREPGGFTVNLGKVADYRWTSETLPGAQHKLLRVIRIDVE